MTDSKDRVIAVVGPTASGKSELATQVAERGPTEIVSIDSAQIYRGMDIGTAKPPPEDLARVPHHMIDIRDPDETVSVAEFQRLAHESIATIHARGGVPMLVGGSGLYFRAVVDPLDFPGTDSRVRAEIAERVEDDPAAAHAALAHLDPDAAGRIDPLNSRRTVRALEVIEITGRKFSEFRVAWDDYKSVYDLMVIGLNCDRSELDRRIEERVDRMITAGLVDEVKHLEAAGFRKSLTSVQALGYAQILAHLDGELSLEDAVSEIKRRTRKFARRQLAWFRADPRVRWFEGDDAGAREYLTTLL